MKPGMDRARQEIERLVDSDDITAGMLVRVRGENIILARSEEASSGEAVVDDRVRLTRLGASQWGLSVMRHNGRWQRTPFSGSLREVMDAVCTFMQHLVAPY